MNLVEKLLSSCSEIPMSEESFSQDLAKVNVFLSKSAGLFEETGSVIITENNFRFDGDWADFDYIVLVSDLDDFHILAGDEGFDSTSGDGYIHDAKYGAFSTLRKKFTGSAKTINLIVTANPIFYGKFVEATNLAVSLNLTTKTQRKRLFGYVLYGWDKDVFESTE
jgi:hypothetical protein